MFVFAGGGTGGHLLPGLAVAKELQANCPQVKIHFLVTQRQIDEQILNQAGYSYTQQMVEPFSLRPWGFLTFSFGLLGSIRDAAKTLAILRPTAVLGMGGFASAPAARVASKLKIPLALLNPDAQPGLANKWLAKRAAKIFVQWPTTAQSLTTRTNAELLVTGCPVRKHIFSATRQEGIERFALDADKKVLLVPGGSQGAMNVNRTVIELLGQLDKLSDSWQILHLTGPDKLEPVQRGYEEAATQINHKLLDFTSAMPQALGAADVVLSRAGASSLAEFTAKRLPAVLMPYPYGRNQHQTANARCLADVGAAVIVPDKCDAKANAAAVGNVLLDLMKSPQKLAAMSKAYEPLFKANAAGQIAQELLNLARV